MHYMNSPHLLPNLKQVINSNIIGKNCDKFREELLQLLESPDSMSLLHITESAEVMLKFNKNYLDLLSRSFENEEAARYFGQRVGDKVRNTSTNTRMLYSVEVDREKFDRELRENLTVVCMILRKEASRLNESQRPVILSIVKNLEEESLYSSSIIEEALAFNLSPEARIILEEIENALHSNSD